MSTKGNVKVRSSVGPSVRHLAVARSHIHDSPRHVFPTVEGSVPGETCLGYHWEGATIKSRRTARLQNPTFGGEQDLGVHLRALLMDLRLDIQHLCPGRSLTPGRT